MLENRIQSNRCVSFGQNHPVSVVTVEISVPADNSLVKRKQDIGNAHGATVVTTTSLEQCIYNCTPNCTRIFRKTTIYIHARPDLLLLLFYDVRVPTLPYRPRPYFIMLFS